MAAEPRRPDWFTALRPEQEELVAKAVDLFHSGVKVVVAEAPPGVGKTLSAVEIGQRLNAPTIYTATTKQLQAQAARDFPWAKVLKGRSNYIPSGVEDGLDITCEDCDATKVARSCPQCGDTVPAAKKACGECGTEVDPKRICTFCPDVYECPYTVAKISAATAELAVLNTAYLIREVQGYESLFKHRPFVVIDEADLLEGNIGGFVEVAISPYMQRRVGITPPERKTVAATWPDWLETTIKRIDRQQKRLTGGDVKVRRFRRRLNEVKANLNMCLEDLRQDLNTWVYDYSTPRIVFRPVRIAHLAKDRFWSRLGQVLLMSATIISPQVMADDLGLEEHEWASITCPWVFPAVNRPVICRPVAEMTRRLKDESWPKMAVAVREVMDEYPTQRILVHCVSYDLAAYLTEHLESERVVTYTQSRDRMTALDTYKTTPSAVLIAPSMERGVDLPDDLTRIQIICKIPWPNQGDKQVNARLHSPGGQSWYAVETIRSIVQASGRAIRHHNDYGVTFILDRQFMSLAKRWGHLMPQGWREAVTTKSAGWTVWMWDEDRQRRIGNGE